MPSKFTAPARRVATCLVAIACANCSPNPGGRIHGDLLVHEPAVLRLEHSDLTRAVDLGEVSFPIDGGARRSENGSCLEPGAAQVAVEHLVSDSEIQATELEVRVRGVRRSPLTMEWRRADGATLAHQQLYWRDAIDHRHERYRFDLTKVAERAAGDTVHLSIGAEPDRVPCVQRISWRRWVADSERLAELDGDVRRVEMDHEIRDARVFASGVPFVVELPASAGQSVIEGQLGLFGGSLVSARVRAELERSDGSTALLLDRPVDTGGPARWTAVSIEKSSVRVRAGDRLSLTTELVLADPDAPAVAAWSDLRLVSAATGDRVSPRPNVVLVSLDTLRADRMSLYGAARQTSPRLTAWAERDATLFTQAIAPAPSTLPSHTSIFSGLHAFHHGTVSTLPAPGSLRLLAERLRDAGYATQAITGAGFLDPRYGLDQGFERYRYWGSRFDVVDELADGIARATAWLDGGPVEPFFLFFHTYEVHGPFRPREPYFSSWGRVDEGLWAIPEPAPVARRPGADPPHRLMVYRPGDEPSKRPAGASEIGLVEDLYDSGIANVDATVGGMIERFRAAGLLNRTLFIVTSDHGEALGEHGLAGHGFLYDDNLRVPLIVDFPGASHAGRTIERQVQLVDLVPTILEVAGLAPPDDVDGRSLMPLLRGDGDVATRVPAVSYSGSLGLSLRFADRLKFILYDGLGPDRELRHRLFRLDVDPGESSNLAASSNLVSRLATESAALLRSASGIRIHWRPDGTRAHSVSLQAPWIAGADVSCFVGRCTDLALHESTIRIASSASEIEFILRPPTVPEAPLRLGVVNAATGAGELGTELRVGEGASFLVLDEAADAEWVESSEGSRWSLAIYPQKSSAFTRGQDPSQTSSDLREQLRALGYLN